MPTSDPTLIHDMVRIICIIKPKKVLDIGCGFGKWGFLCREFTDIIANRYNPKDWQVQIDAIEIFKDYITPVHNYIYDNITIGDIRKMIIVDYDLIILGDVLEHMTKEEALKVLEDCRKSGKNVVISTPKGYMPQGKVLDNENERHIFGFEMKEMHDLGATIIDAGRVFIAWFKNETQDIDSKSS